MNINEYREEVSNFINNKYKYEYKMEIGADLWPLCNEKNTTYVSNCENSLLRTYATSKSISKSICNPNNTEYLLADAESIPIISSSMDCIVSAYFPWNASTEEEMFIKFLIILSEWKRIVKKKGNIIIMSHKDWIRYILQISKVIKLKPIKRFKCAHKNDWTIVLEV